MPLNRKNGLAALIGGLLGIAWGIAALLLLERRRRTRVPMRAALPAADLLASDLPPTLAGEMPGEVDGSALRRLHRRLMRLRLYRAYGWAILPLLAVNLLLLHGNLYYNKFYSYDMPQHFNNMISVRYSGAMPPPPLTALTYEAHQPPIFYVLTDWLARLGDTTTGDGFLHIIPAAMLAQYAAWSLLSAAFVQAALRRAPPTLKALTLGVVMLFPMCVLAGAMYSNDLAVIALSEAAVLALWTQARSGRQLDRGRWLRAAALAGLAAAFKTNGIVVVALYAALAGHDALDYLLRRRPDLALRVARLALIGLPLAAIPWGLNAWHASRYGGDLIGATTPTMPVTTPIPLTFFTTFDTTIFQVPFAFGPGTGSFWTLQYVTLHNDYYNHWNSLYYDMLPPDQVIYFGTRQPIAWWRFQSAILVQVLAVPITLVMALGFFYPLVRLVRRPRRAVRDGSLVIVLLTVLALGAQLVRLSAAPDMQMVLMIHARYTGFLYIVLFIVGVRSLWKLIGRREGLPFQLVQAVLVMDMMAYAAVVYQMMWLPTTWSYGRIV